MVVETIRNEAKKQFALYIEERNLSKVRDISRIGVLYLGDEGSEGNPPIGRDLSGTLGHGERLKKVVSQITTLFVYFIRDSIRARTGTITTRR